MEKPTLVDPCHLEGSQRNLQVLSINIKTAFDLGAHLLSYTLYHQSSRWIWKLNSTISFFNQAAVNCIGRLDIERMEREGGPTLSLAS